MVKWIENGHPEGESFKFTPIQLEVHTIEQQSHKIVVEDAYVQDVKTTSITVFNAQF